MSQKLEPIIFPEKPQGISVRKSIDYFESALEELSKMGKAEARALWVYFPWNETLLRLVSEETYYELLTARNKNLISREEQKKLYNLRVAVLGLSTGSKSLATLVRSGGGRSIRIADGDSFEITNLNRSSADLTSLGGRKAHIVAQQLWQINPYIELDIWNQNIEEKDLSDFLSRVDLLIDAADSLDIKVKVRRECQRLRIPVLMATDLGFGALLDVERYDLETNLPIFHGRLEGFSQEQSAESLQDRKKWVQLANQIVGEENFPEELIKTLPDIGQTIPAVPQLDIASASAGAFMITAVFKIANHHDLPSGRYSFNFLKILESERDEIGRV